MTYPRAPRAVLGHGHLSVFASVTSKWHTVREEWVSQRFKILLSPALPTEARHCWDPPALLLTQLSLSLLCPLACQEGVTVLQKELETIKVPNFSGIFKTKHMGKGSYEFYR